MIRPLMLLAAVALAGGPGCASGERAPPPNIAAPTANPGAAARRPSPLASPDQRFVAPAPSEAVRDRAAVAEACRRDADRVVQYRDRGQLMREDERDARIGTDSSIYARRTETDRLGRVFERDRIAAECLQQEPRPAPPRR